MSTKHPARARSQLALWLPLVLTALVLVACAESAGTVDEPDVDLGPSDTGSTTPPSTSMPDVKTAMSQKYITNPGISGVLRLVYYILFIHLCSQTNSMNHLIAPSVLAADFGNLSRDLDMINHFPAPKWFKDRVAKSQCKQVLNCFFTQVVINSEYLIFFEATTHPIINSAC